MAYSLGVLRAILFASASPVVARLRPVRLARVLKPSAVHADRDERMLQVAERALDLTGRLIAHTCYTRGITRYFVLSRAGYDVTLVFGLDPAPDSPDGHCWVVLDGRPYLEQPERLARFVPVWSIGDVAT